MTRLVCTILLLAWVLPTYAAAPHSKSKAFKVVLDPGHGGQDEGAVHDHHHVKITEKELTLALAQSLAKYLRAKKIDVILTRTKDKDLALPERTAMANRAGADLFISIHMNSTDLQSENQADGVETYILNQTSDATSRRLAALENSVLIGSAIEKFGQNDVSLILKDLTLDANLASSKRLACAIQTNVVNATGRTNRGIRQALFYVLLGADMPSVLVEAGFINSAHDLELVTTKAGQDKLARSMARAIEQYQQALHSKFAASALSRCQVR